MEHLVCRGYLAPEVHLEKKVDLCLDRKEMRGSRASRGLRGPLNTLILQKICTSKESRVHQESKGPVEFRDYQVWMASQGSKERRALWGFLGSGVTQGVLVPSESKASQGFGEVQVFQVSLDEKVSRV